MISVGIDISKGKSMICFLKPYGEVVREAYEIQHSDSELNKLVEDINMNVTKSMAIDNEFVYLRKGKKNYFIINFK